MPTTEEVRAFALSHGCDLVGIASMDAFREEPPERHPASIFPDARSVVVLGRAIQRGAFRGLEEGTYWHGPSPILDTRLSYEVGRFLEDRGCEAVPIYPLPPQRWPEGVPVAEDRPAPNVTPNVHLAAIAAGLGEFGYCGVFLTPEFGPRQALGMLLTDADLEPDGPRTQTVCDGLECLACAKACPLGAISTERATEVEMGGRKMVIGEVNFRACRKCPNGAFPNPDDPQNGEPNRLAAVCVRACIAHLEATGTLSAQYERPFRSRETWSLGLLDT